eukprot:7196250-Pyramimonas_sp.AAC.1
MAQFLCRMRVLGEEPQQGVMFLLLLAREKSAMLQEEECAPPAFFSVALIRFWRNALRVGVILNVHIEAECLLRAECSTGGDH